MPSTISDEKNKIESVNAPAEEPSSEASVSGDDDSKSESDLTDQEESQLGEVVQQYEQLNPQVQGVFARQISRTFKGPLPHPDILKGYEGVLPGAAERVFSSFERQQEHRMKLEKLEMDLNFEGMEKTFQHSNIGLISGVVLVAILLISSVLLVFNDKPIAGFTFFVPVLVAIFYGVRKKNKTDDSNETESEED